LVEVAVEGGRSVTYPELATADPQPKTEVIWEVEVEDEVMAKLGGAYVGYLSVDKDPITFQNQLRMEGFVSIKVCALGYLKILLWSDKVGEAKEVVESVGWWCSMFERVVPWSPDLISNQRVAWLKCYGVPVHAWGTDLFRSLAFKFGRFVDVDDNTKQMQRCDFARVKVVTGVTKLIDSFMVVKVQGQRFDIRVMEENGGWTEEGRCFGRRAEDREEISSRASSDGGASAVAVVDDFSESGSDADVSKSCQVLLEVEKRGGGRKVSYGCLGKEIGTSIKESEDIPNILGKSDELVVKRVNVDGDRSSGPIVVESAESEKLLGVAIVGPHQDPMKGATSVVVSSKNWYEEEEGVGGEVGHRLDVIGPAQVEFFGSPFKADKGVCLQNGRCNKEAFSVGGPCVLRTRSGDLLLNGLPNSGPSNIFVSAKETQTKESVDSQAQSEDPINYSADNQAVGVVLPNPP
ncbi:DUF4283 domain protein, partial [Trifolium medium]|nr:DUF4283 domain protein [Trifolium medium]